MNRTLLFLFLALAVGVLIGAFILNDRDIPLSDTSATIQNSAIAGVDPGTATKSKTPFHSAAIDELRQLLQNEINARRALEQKLDQLSLQVAANGQIADTLTSKNHTEEPAVGNDTSASSPDKDWFNQQGLLDSGMDNIQVSELKNFFEQQEMDRLYLRDQSIRESWNRDQYREAMQLLGDEEAEFKNQIGESAYDAYLYATGRSNRVVVTNVLASAQAGTAGVLAGDHIIRYDNQRIYDQHDLREATTGGNISDTVALEIKRGGKTMQFYLVRGPLGIRMNSVSAAP